MTKRAERLAEYLESSDGGWTVFELSKECKKCGSRTTNTVAAYCSMCGGKLPEKASRRNEKETLDDLEKAIKFALKIGK